MSMEVDTQAAPTKAQNRQKEVRIRSSLVPGTVCILLAGPYKGKRVVMLKKLSSGNIVVTGPFRVNGIPLRRANPRFVIATSTKVPVDGIDVSNLTDSFFVKKRLPRLPTGKNRNHNSTQETKLEKKTRLHEEMQENSKKEHKALQQKIDAKMEAFLNKDENSLLKQYLKTPFTLRNKMYPHELRF